MKSATLERVVAEVLSKIPRVKRPRGGEGIGFLYNSYLWVRVPSVRVDPSGTNSTEIVREAVTYYIGHEGEDITSTVQCMTATTKKSTFFRRSI